MRNRLFTLLLFFASVYCATAAFGQNNFDGKNSETKTAKAKAVVSRAIKNLGGQNYLNVRTSVGRGKFSLLKDGRTASFQSFVDVIVLPDKERTDFTEHGSKIVQVNAGDKGWIYEEHLESFRDQNEKAVANFKRSLKTTYDYLLRGQWNGNAKLSYEGRRRASLGKRNDVLKLTFKDGFEVEYEFSEKGLPMKTVYYQVNSEDARVKIETRYAQFLIEQGILTPFIIDQYSDGRHVFRVNYQSMEYNKRIPEEIFVKPATPKKLRKKLKI